jgi:D-alanyl-D-alanine carboxypeptidase
MHAAPSRRWSRRRRLVAAGGALAALPALPGVLPGGATVARAAQAQVPAAGPGGTTRRQAGVTSSLPPELARQLTGALIGAHRELGFPGAVGGVDTPQGDWAAAIGVQDMQTGQPMTPDVHQRIGSITKTFTGTVLLQLVQEGRLSLEDPIGRYVEGVPNGQAITLRNLANMTSGL